MVLNTIHSFPIKNLLFLCLVAFLGVAKTQDFLFSRPKVAKELSQITVLAMAQDEKGFLWVGTQGGLNRYDGYEFNVVKHIPFDSSSLSSNYVSAICSDKKGKLWVGTQLDGLNLYDIRTKKSQHFSIESKRHKLNSNDINSLLLDKLGQLWVGTTRGVNRIISETVAGKTTYKTQSWLTPSARDNKQGQHVNTVFEDANGKIWVGTRAGIYYFENPTPKKEGIGDLKWVQADTAAFKVRSIVQDNTGKIWWATDRGLYRYDPLENKAAPFGQDLFGEGDKGLESLYIDSRNILWIGTSDGRLLGLRLQGLPYLREVIQPSGYSLENASKITCIQESRSPKGLIWVGTYADGLLKVVPFDHRFTSSSLEDVKTLGTKYVNTIYKDSQNLWIGTDRGIVRYNNKDFSHETYDFTGDKFPSRSNIIQHIYKDGNENVWVATFGGLYLMQKKGNTYTPIKQTFTENCGDKGFVFVYEDTEHNIYLCAPKGLNIYNPLTKKWLPCSVIPDSSLVEQARNRIHAVYRDAKNRFWIGTSDGLLLLRDMRNPFEEIGKRKFIHLEHNPNDSTSLRASTIICMHEDLRGNIWLGTTDGLILVKDEGKKISYQNFAEREGLFSTTIYGILEDSIKKHLWLSTNKGLFRFHLTTHRFENFNEKDGLQSNEFNAPAYFSSKEGEMFFGGTRGYTRFFPNKVKSDTTAPRVAITGYTDKNGILHEILYQEERKIELDYSDNSFNVHFIGIQFSDNENLRYYYYMEDLSREQNIKWVELEGLRQVSYSNLAPGRYRLHVTGNSNNTEDIKNGNEETIEIIIHPPFYKRGWFYLLLLLGIGSALWLAHQFRVQQKVARVMDLERVRKNAAADFHDELGHKLTVISLFANVVKSSLPPEQQVAMTPHLEKIVNTSSSLYLSMKDLLWVLDPKKDSLYDMALMLKDFSDQLFDKSGVAFYTEGINDDMKGFNLLMPQKRHIALIFKEVMNNSMKHSQCKNTSLAFNWDKEAHHLQITFKDDGKGFNPQDANTGNGLVNLKDRAQKVNGTIEFQSAPGNGTKVIFETTFMHFRPKPTTAFGRFLQKTGLDEYIYAIENWFRKFDKEE